MANPGLGVYSERRRPIPREGRRPAPHMKCPRCQSSITATPDPEGFVACPGCGARLRSRSAPATLGALNERMARLDPDTERFPDATNPNATLPPGTPLPRIPRPGSPEALAALAEVPAPSRPRPVADDTPRVMRGPREVLSLEALMAEVKALRHSQEEMLALLRAGSFPAGERPGFDVAQQLGLPVTPTVRARQRKSVRVVDDKPDVIVMEIDIEGPMAGKDVIDLIKATMQWVDVPIVLYTRAPITSQREARTVHGADDFVSKQDGAEPMLARVVMQFRR